MKSSAQCEDELQASIDLHYGVVMASVALTLFVVLVHNVCLKERFEGAPGLAAQYWFVVGTVKIILAVCLFTVVRAKCPDDCTCTNVPFPFYAAVALTVGFLWLRRGHEKLQQSRAVVSQGAVGDDKEAVFQSVPTVEMA